MRITVSTEDGEKVTVIEVDKNEVIENVKALIEVDLEIPLAQQSVFFNGRMLGNAVKLDEFGVKEDDMLLVKRGPPTGFTAPGPAQPVRGPMDRAAELQNYLRTNPHVMNQIRENNPRLADAVTRGDSAQINQILLETEQARRQAEVDNLRRIQMLEADPFDINAQAQIEEEIRQKNVAENFDTALEHQPEAFGHIVMLYIEAKVNGVPVKAFVDSGAQATIMSQACAERCGLMRLVDKRFAGVAKGVGTSKIIGRVHVAPMTVADQYFPCTFTILENQDMDFLLGLDMLRRHQCCIDLRTNSLQIGDLQVPFLAEKDIPVKWRGHEEESGQGASSPSTASSPSSTSAPTRSVPSAPTPVQASPPAAQPSPAMSEEKIAKIIELGFTRDQALAALRMFNGNEEMAASYLFQAAGGF